MTHPQSWAIGLVPGSGTEPVHMQHHAIPGQYYMTDSSGMNQFPVAPSVSTLPVPAKIANNDTTAAVTTELSSGETHGQISGISEQVPDSGERNTNDGTVVSEQPAPEEEIDITINNVVCCFSTRCHLNLKRIAQEGMNVIYRRECGMVSMKLRNPYTTASIWSSGKITCTGATSEVSSHVAARRFARLLQSLGFRTRFANFRIVNVLGTCSLPFGIRINSFSAKYKEASSYEPELHPGVTYRIKNPKATLKIFSTGSITVTAPSVHNIQLAIEHIFPLVSDFKMAKREQNTTGYLQMMPRKRVLAPARTAMVALESDDDDSFDSDESRD